MSSRVCNAPDCARPHYAWDYCRAHYARWKQHGDPLAGKPITASGRKRKNAGGYNMRQVPGRGQVAVHRLVMEESLGRRLVKGETVHHKDGIRTNNNLANLELMVSWHPPGQRPADLVPWAKEVLRRYAPEELASFREVATTT